MNLINKAVVSGILVITGIGGAYCGSPAFRAVFSGQVHDYLGWTEEARLADPVGFVDHVEEKLQQDIGQFQEIRRDLSGEVGELVKKEREQRALLANAEAFAEEFRDVYQEGIFPVEVRNAAYTEDELHSQLSTTLAEIDAYEENIQRLSRVRQDAEEKIEAIISLSQPRHDKTFGGLQLDEELTRRNADAQCGLQIIDLTSGDVVHWLKIEGDVSEIYDVIALPEVLRPMALGFKTDEIHRLLVADDQGVL